MLISDLASRTAPAGHGRLLDLACGTGQLAFPLADRFAETWAVDQEPDMIDFVQAKSAGKCLPNLADTVSFAYELARRQ